MKQTECRFCQRAHAARSPAECPNVERTVANVRKGRPTVVVYFKADLGLPPLEIDQPVRGGPTIAHRGARRG